MRIEGKFCISNVPIQRLYESLLKPEILLLCVPGAEEIEKIDDKTYNCVIKQTFGPVSMKFRSRNILTNVTPPTRIELEGEGDVMGKSGKFVHNTVIDLMEDNKVVEVCYSSDVNIAGAMAALGNRVIKAKARKLEEEIARALQEKLQSLG